MRLIGTLKNENEARRLGHYLKSQGLDATCEVAFDAPTGHMSYQFWAHNEDKLGEAAAIFEEFQKNPSDSKFDAPLIEEPENLPPENETLEYELPKEPAHRFGTHITSFFLALCVMIFFINTLQTLPLREEGRAGQTFLMTPIQAALLYDLPPAIEKIEQVIKKYEVKPGQKVSEMPAELKAEVEILNTTPYWRGIYEWIVLKIKGSDTAVVEGPLFLRIKQGEIWRLFTPCILHYDLLHILFNMLWLWYLGRPVEQRIGPFRTLLLTLLVGIGSNTLQYFMSGPFFIGYSGVITGLAGFTWMRERLAPWEGYPLNRATILFLAIFIGAIFVLQAVSFFIQIFTASDFSPNIANTAHIGGAVIGALLARYSYFAQRVK